MERGAPEEQMAAFKQGNGSEEDIQCQKCQFTQLLYQPLHIYKIYTLKH